MDKNNTGSIIDSAEDIFKKLPPLPENIIQFVVGVTPWFAIIFGILGALGALSGFGLWSAYAPYAMYGVAHGYGLGFIAVVGLAISSVLLLAAFPGLRSKKVGGWNLLLASEVVSLASSVVGISIGGIIGTLIAFYILFQIKPKYK